MTMRHLPDCFRAMAVLTIMFTVLPVLAKETESAIDYDALVTTVDEMSQKLEVLSGAVDQTRFDPEKWLDKLEYDADKVLQAVSGQVHFQPYPGVLRGVSGTLRARAGNSLDQALLVVRSFLLSTLACRHPPRQLLVLPRE
jgi:hypothetical protein